MDDRKPDLSLRDSLWVDVRDFADARTRPRDGVIDWAPTIQLAIDCLVKENVPALLPGDYGTASVHVDFGTLYLPPGIYRLTDPLYIRRIEKYKPTMDSPEQPFFDGCSLEIVGDTAGEEGGAILVADFRNIPAVIIQGGIAIRLRNLVILGQNDWINIHGVDPRDMTTHQHDDIYIDRRLPLVRDHYKSPYAGICVDPFFYAVKDPAERYPGIGENYDNYATNPETGDVITRFSTNIHIDNCRIRGFVAGIALSPAGGPNAENIRITDTRIEATESALVIGQDQIRHVVLRNVSIYGARYAINCAGYGYGNGNCPSIYGGEIAGVKYLLHAVSPGSASAIQGLQVDSILSLGQCFGGASLDGYVFDGCHFRLGRVPRKDVVVAGQAVGARTVNAHFFNYTNTVFNECTFSVDSDPAAKMGRGDFFPIRMLNGGALSFIGCRFLIDDPRTDIPLWVSGDTGHVSYRDCVLVSTDQTMLFSERHTGPLRLQNVPPGTFYAQPQINSDRWARFVTGVFPRITLGKGTLALDKDGTATIAFPKMGMPEEIAGALTDPLQRILQLGDLLLAEEPILDARLPLFTDEDEGNPKEARAEKLVLGQFIPPVQLVMDNVVLTIRGVPRAVSNGAYTAHVSYFPKVHPITRGKVTKESDVLQVTDFESSSLQEAWQKDDRIRGAGIVPGTYVLGFLGGDKIQMSAKATADSVEDILLYDADARIMKLR